MAGGKSNNSYLIVLFGMVLIASNVALGITEIAAAPKPDPKDLERIKECTKNVAPECGKEILKATFSTGTVSTNCCKQLVKMGKACHDDLNLIIARGPETKAEMQEYIAKSDQVYRKCSSIVV